MIVTLQTLIFFRESLINALDRLLRPYYNKFSLAFSRNSAVSEDDDPDEQVFAEFDDERGVVFYPPMYLQRYAAVSDCLMDERWCGELEKVVDLGYHDMSFIKYLKEVQGIKYILGVDIESIPLRCSIDLISCDDYRPKRENPLEVTLFKGNAADPDYRLIGCDAVVGIEVIEHMLPHDLDRLIHTVFGFIKPQVAIFTTPNGDFNILFKALEKNGLRRLDHFFEWSRDQFHDWCSNIICRYPQYTVSCKGIGPGPIGTEHLGCCSQMAVFVAKDYIKQQNLDINSLALVAASPSPESLTTLINDWESHETPNETIMIEPAKIIESYSELQSTNQSSITLFLTTPSNSSAMILYEDKTSQCNLDSETGKGYLMFDYEQMCFDVVNPRRHVRNKVYHIEDVYNRLSCTTTQVKKFSKTTQNLMAKNKVDTLMHTREVVDEIRHLTKLLNFSKDCNNELENGTHTWCNINWGDNAPYWNQYYKIVKKYNYPFEVKSDECRILDLISDEINRLIDAQFEEDCSFEVTKLEIPIERLMNVVEHITDDVEKIKDILEWNGYQIEDNMVIHSRLVADCPSVATLEGGSLETDLTYSDWDSTDIRSSSMSDGSTTVPDYHARCLRRALDQKVRKVRSMLTADEDITTELDRVVCRLMKLALRTSKGRDSPPPTRWMQCKLLDLLTLTEKAIERRRRHYIDSYPLKAINYDVKTDEMAILEKIKDDDTALKIVDKYKHLINPAATEESLGNYQDLDFDLNDDFTISSAASEKGYEFIDNHHSSIVRREDTLPDTIEFHDNDVNNQGKSKLERTQAWVEEDIEVVDYPEHNGYFDKSLMKTDGITDVTKYKKKHKGKPSIELNCVICKKSHSKAFKQIRNGDKSKDSKTLLVKKSSRKSYTTLGVHTNNKYVSIDYKTYKAKPRKKKHKTVYPTASKPIPVSLLQLCQPEMIGNEMGLYDSPDKKENGKADIRDQGKGSYAMQVEVADTKQSLLMDIVSHDAHETIALRRTIGTDADDDSMACEHETLIRSVSNTLMHVDDFSEKRNVSTEYVNSQTIFLYDIDEPTTSKGIRHISMDVQCGPDTTVPSYSTLSATTSLTRMPKLFTAGIKIGDSLTDTKISDNNFGICTDHFKDIKNNKPTIDAFEIKDSKCIRKQDGYSTSTNDHIEDVNHFNETARKRSIGIKIKDSKSNSFDQMGCTDFPGLFMLSATSSLTRMPKLFTAAIRIRSSKTKNKMKSIDCGTDNAKSITDIRLLPIDGSIGVTSKDKLNVHNAVCSTETRDLFHKSNPILMSTKVIQSTPKNMCQSDKIKDCDPMSLKIECVTNTQRLHDESDDSTQKSLKEKTSPKIIKERNSANLIEDMYSSINTKKSPNKSNISSRHPLENVKKLLKDKPKQKTAELKSKKFDANLPKRMKYRLNTVSFTKSKVSFETTTKLLKSASDHNDSESNLPSEIQCSTISPNNILSEPKAMEVYTLKIDAEEQSSEPLKTKYLTNNQETTNVGPSSKETILLKSHNKLLNDNSASDFYERADDCCKLQTQNILQTCYQQILSDVNKTDGNPGQPVCKYVKPKLSKAGIQVYSYRDTQCLSEDVMYQGEWQINRPKILTKRKCFSSLLPKKNDCNIKKNVNSKERIKAKSTKNFKIRTLKQYSVILANSNQNLSKNKLKPCHTTSKVRKLNTVGTGTNPFRNVLKVPSSFATSSVSHKNKKSPFVIKNPPTPKQTVTTDDKTPPRKIKKNYIPFYLRQRALNATNNILHENHNLSFDSAKAKDSKEKSPKPLIRSKTEEIKRDLIKCQIKPKKLHYVVFRNELEKKKSNGQQMKGISDSAKTQVADRQRSSSPISQNSSTCSSPCSIATVRVVSAQPNDVSNHPRSVSPYITDISTGNTGTKTPPNLNKKIIAKRYKSVRPADNKENIPQTSKQKNVAKKGIGKLAKSAFMGQKKDSYVAHVKEVSPLQSTADTLTKQKTQKSNVNIPTAVNINEKISSPAISLSPSHKSSVKFDASLSTSGINEAEYSQTSNLVLVIEQARERHVRTDTPKLSNGSVMHHDFLASWIDNTDKETADSQTDENCDDISAMRAILNETLDFIDDPFDKHMIDSDTIILSRENLISGADSTGSRTSFKTIITDEDNEILKSGIEFALNRSFDITLDDESTMSLNDTGLTVTDFDALSFESITSGSKLSGYLSADNEFSSSVKLPKCMEPTPNSASLRDIYERKDQLYQPTQSQNVSGSLANQAFSGFTINGDPFYGDKADLINFIDSETGSFAACVTRQTTSEELLISGRSSESYASCLLDDDSVVPNWLFQLISHQQSAMDELEPPAEIMVQVPVAEPMFDDNGNVMEVPGLGAGAGDGRGMHSDHSQDSSGRGTSVSSSDISSGLQSEAISIDPAAFAAEFELLSDSVESSVALANPAENTDEATGGRQGPVESESVERSFSGGESRRYPRVISTASDVDADVSSIDTDAPDSSDN